MTLFEAAASRACGRFGDLGQKKGKLEKMDEKRRDKTEERKHIARKKRRKNEPNSNRNARAKKQK